MTHNDVKIKFLIEYDKANVTSSYPSLTDYEIAVILNKAYLALIAQKVTGNNVRRVPFEADIKAISDLQELVFTTSIQKDSGTVKPVNAVQYTLPQNFLYYVTSVVTMHIGQNDILAPVTLVNHEDALRFKQSVSNRPWIKNAVCEIESDKIILLYDNYEEWDGRTPTNLDLTYIKEPSKFTLSFNGTFELNDTMAEELITLAVTFALENVESSRLQSQIQTRGLEA